MASATIKKMKEHEDIIDEIVRSRPVRKKVDVLVEGNSAAGDEAAAIVNTQNMLLQKLKQIENSLVIKKEPPH